MTTHSERRLNGNVSSQAHTGKMGQRNAFLGRCNVCEFVRRLIVTITAYVIFSTLGMTWKTGLGYLATGGHLCVLTTGTYGVARLAFVASTYTILPVVVTMLGIT